MLDTACVTFESSAESEEDLHVWDDKWGQGMDELPSMGGHFRKIQQDQLSKVLESADVLQTEPGTSFVLHSIYRKCLSDLAITLSTAICFPELFQKDCRI